MYIQQFLICDWLHYRIWQIYRINPYYAEIILDKPWSPVLFFSIWNHHKCLSELSPLHYNNYVLGIVIIHFLILLVRGSTLDVIMILTSKVSPRDEKVKSVHMDRCFCQLQAMLIYNNYIISLQPECRMRHSNKWRIYKNVIFLFLRSVPTNYPVLHRNCKYRELHFRLSYLVAD